MQADTDILQNEHLDSEDEYRFSEDSDLDVNCDLPEDDDLLYETGGDITKLYNKKRAEYSQSAAQGDKNVSSTYQQNTSKPAVEKSELLSRQYQSKVDFDQCK